MSLLKIESQLELRLIAGGVGASAAIRFEARFRRILAEVAAKHFAGPNRRAYRAVADVVAALDAEVTHLGTRRGLDGVIRNLDAYDLGRRIRRREEPEVGVVKRLRHAELRRDELRVGGTARSH
jgi:hypothetical protein